MNNEELDPLSLFAMAELKQLRAQAFDLLDRCLAENNLAPIVGFIERQVTGNPPHLQLLREIGEGLHQRLLSLRAYHYDVRHNVIKTLNDDFNVDLTPLAPPTALDQYHKLDPKQVLNYVRQQGNQLSDEEVLILGKLVEASIKTAGSLQSQIKLVGDLQTMVLDWLDALNATVGRRYWSEDESDTPLH